jgi:hypothetical protein
LVAVHRERNARASVACCIHCHHMNAG